MHLYGAQAFKHDAITAQTISALHYQAAEPQAEVCV